MWELLRRAAFSVLALFVISFLVFLLTNVVPGSPGERGARRGHARGGHPRVGSASTTCTSR